MGAQIPSLAVRVWLESVTVPCVSRWLSFCIAAAKSRDSALTDPFPFLGSLPRLPRVALAPLGAAATDACNFAGKAAAEDAAAELAGASAACLLRRLAIGGGAIGGGAIGGSIVPAVPESSSSRRAASSASIRALLSAFRAARSFHASSCRLRSSTFSSRLRSLSEA